MSLTDDSKHDHKLNLAIQRSRGEKRNIKELGTKDLSTGVAKINILA
jgi:hypothetical protein